MTEERVSNFGDLLWEWTRGPSSGHDGDIGKRRWRRPGIIIGLLGLDDKRGSNRGNDNKSHCRCHGGSTSPAFVVGLFDVDNKRGGNMWQEGNISRLQQGPIVVVACLASRSRTRVAVG